jgi:hypothetical protein
MIIISPSAPAGTRAPVGEYCIDVRNLEALKAN